MVVGTGIGCGIVGAVGGLVCGIANAGVGTDGGIAVGGTCGVCDGTG